MKTDMTIDDLKPLCCGRLPHLAHPWSYNGKTYATNGRVAVRLDGIIDGARVPQKGDRAILMVPQFDKIVEIRVSSFQPLPSFPPLDVFECCDSECPECIKGKRYRGKVVKLRDAIFDTFYLTQIAHLPNIMIAPRGAKKAAKLKFNSGLGAIMPMLPFWAKEGAPTTHP